MMETILKESILITPVRKIREIRRIYKELNST